MNRAPNNEPRVSAPAYIGKPVDEIESAAFLFPELGDDVDVVDISEAVEMIDLYDKFGVMS